MANTETITIEVGARAAVSIYRNGELASCDEFVVFEPLRLQAEQLVRLGECETPNCDCDAINAVFLLCRDVCEESGCEMLVVLRVFDIEPHYSAFSPATPHPVAA